MMSFLQLTKWSMVCAAGVTGSLLMAAEVAPLNAPENWGNVKKADDGLELTHKMTTAKDMIPIDTAKNYQLSGKIRTGSDSQEKMLIYAGFGTFAKDKREIQSPFIIAVKAPMTEVAETAAKGAKTIKLKDTSAWKIPNQFYCLAFNAKPDMSDLPNFDIVEVDNANTDTAANVISLKRPLYKEIAAGTPVRLHRYGGTFLYTMVGGKTLTPEWQEFSGKISGVKLGEQSNNHWRPGTVFAKPMIMTITKENAPKIQFKDLKLEVLDEAK